MQIDRRALLISAAAVASGAAAGLIAERRGWWTPAIIGTPDPDAAITRVLRRGEAALVRAYDAALADEVLADGANLGRLQTYREHHLQHLAALGGDDGDVASAPDPGLQDPADPEAAAPVPPLPRTAAEVPAFFAAAEQQHTEMLSTGVRIGTEGELARLVALIAASETSHAAGWSDA